MNANTKQPESKSVAAAEKPKRTSSRRKPEQDIAAATARAAAGESVLVEFTLDELYILFGSLSNRMLALRAEGKAHAAKSLKGIARKLDRAEAVARKARKAALR